MSVVVMTVGVVSCVRVGVSGVGVSLHLPRLAFLVFVLVVVIFLVLVLLLVVILAVLITVVVATAETDLATTPGSATALVLVTTHFSVVLIISLVDGCWSACCHGLIDASSKTLH